MIEAFRYPAPDLMGEEPKELVLLSIISQSFMQPFSMEDNLLVILTALTSGSGVGFNRAMLFLAEEGVLRGEVWLGPRSAEEARTIWEVLSTPNIGYVEIVEHNRALISQGADSLSARIKPLAYPLRPPPATLPGLAAARGEILLVRDARRDPLVDPSLLTALDVDEFLCVPLLVREEVLGIILLDNAYTRRTIEPKDIKLAGLCGLIAGSYIYATGLHQKMIDMERTAALGEMAMFVTHQLRNPVVAIGGFADQILESPDDAARTRRNLEIIRNEIRRLEVLLTRMANLLRADGRPNAPFDLAGVAAAVVEAQDLAARSKGVELGLESRPGLPQALGDAVNAGEALRNLVVNGLDATPAGGRITVRLRAAGPEIAAEVEDTGRGLSPAQRERIFTPFFSTKEKGMGLGLLYVKRVMDACGGRIEVSARPGGGTTFTLVFRAAGPERTEP